MTQKSSRAARDEQWLQERLDGITGDVRAPRGFTDRVMSVVYREALSPRAAETVTTPPTVLRLYRRIALSFMLTAAVLAGSLLIPRGAYPTLIAPAESGAALGTGTSAAVRGALAGAAMTVQGALGERLIGGGEQ
jgi:hypothetical protein